MIENINGATYLSDFAILTAIHLQQKLIFFTDQKNC